MRKAVVAHTSGSRSHGLGYSNLPAIGKSIACLFTAMRLSIAIWLVTLPISAQKLGIRLVEGHGAINVIDDTTDRHFAVQVEEKYGVPGKEIPVTFTAPETGASGTFKADTRSITVKTDHNGYAVARGFRPNKVAGQYQIAVTAAAPGGELHSAIAQTNALATEESSRLAPKKLFGKLRSTIAGLVSW